MTERCLDLSKGEADIAIRAGEPQDQALVGRKIAEAAWAVYASRSYVERHGRPERKEDIERHFVVACDGAIAHYPAARWLRSTAPHATIATRSDNWPALVLAVKSGAGVAPLQIVQGDCETDLVRLFDIGPELVTPYFLLIHRDIAHLLYGMCWQHPKLAKRESQMDRAAYASTLFDYIRRAMPFNAPQSLSANEVYALAAYVLYLNNIVPENTVLDEKTLAKVEMPNRNGFTSPDPRPDIKTELCMTNC